ncbi:MAG TPA: DUF3267 domain-containing protein [Anaerolineales bacterium]|nr:DUF3267 domain-containing protein [Anaerolineales bacterium]
MDTDKTQWDERIIPNNIVNIAALLTFLPLTLVAVLPFILIHGRLPVGRGFQWMTENPLALAGILFGSVLIHEALHAIGWAWFGRVSLNEMKFGILKGNPYTHVKVPLPARAYRWGGALPGIVLGAAPAAVSWFNGNGALMLFGAVMLAAAGGDAIMLWLLRDVRPDTLVQDHPSAIGCLIKRTDRSIQERSN